MDKRAQLLELARKRQATRWKGYTCVGDYHNGIYECAYVSPYSKTAGNVNADILIMLQDWSSDGSLSGPVDEDAVALGHTPKLATNRNLVKLLKAALAVALEDVYGTNLFPFIKSGGMTGPIPEKDLVRAAQEFALPQIRIIDPLLIVCLGLATFNGLRGACGLSPSLNLTSAIESPFDLGKARVWCQAHTGAWGQYNRNRRSGVEVDLVSRDWKIMGEDFARTARLNSGPKRSRKQLDTIRGGLV